METLEVIEIVKAINRIDETLKNILYEIQLK